jgi:hypothetical protein
LFPPGNIDLNRQFEKSEDTLEWPDVIKAAGVNRAICPAAFNMWAIQRIPSLDEWVKKLSERHDLALRKRLNTAINMSAEQRYAELEKTYPEFIQRFLQHIIASYLGINKATLSRIRGQASKK